MLVAVSCRVCCADKHDSFLQDSTLIRTKSGATYPKGRYDWRWLLPEIPDILRTLYHDNWKIVIFTNQSGIVVGKQKANDICGKILDMVSHLHIPVQAFVASDEDLYRKPATKMWDTFSSHYNDGVEIDMQTSQYVGDAAGRPRGWDGNSNTAKDFSVADRKFARNIGLRFYTPEEYFLRAAAAPFEWGGIDPTQLLNEHSIDPAPMHGSQQLLAASKAGGEASTPHTSSISSSSSSSTFLTLSSSSLQSTSQELLLFVGPPASGKSTFARKHFVSQGYVHVNQDTLKNRDKCVRAAKEVNWLCECLLCVCTHSKHLTFVLLLSGPASRQKRGGRQHESRRRHTGTIC